MPQEYTQRYTVVCFFDVNPNTEFASTDWPPHVTMLDTFKTDWAMDVLNSAINDLTILTEPLEVLVTNTAVLGDNKDEPVKLLESSSGLLSLHAHLLSMADKGNFVFNMPEFVGDGFLPHATDQKDSVINIGKRYQLNNISLVDMFPNNDHLQRKVLNTFSLASRK